MKKLIATVFIAFVSAVSCQAQIKTKIDAQGNYVQVSDSGADSVKAVKTGKTFTSTKGETFDVMQSSKGRLFVMRVSKKSGKAYKMYLN